MAIDQRILEEAAPRHRASATASMEARSQGLRTAFLCHSHLDRRLASGLVVYLADKGIKLYVDWADTEMPQTPNARTADRIQVKIKTCDYFLFLATQNSTASRWCPWEVGFADAARGRDRVLIIPTRDRSGNYHGNEYLQLYPKLDESILGTLNVYPPNAETGRPAKVLFG